MSALWGEREYLISYFSCLDIVMLGILSPNYLCPELSYCDRFQMESSDADSLLRRIKGAIVWLCSCISSFWKCFLEEHIAFLRPAFFICHPHPSRAEMWLPLYLQPTDKNTLPFPNCDFSFKGPLKGLKNLIAYIFLKIEISGNLQGRRALKENAKFHSNYHH